MQTRAPMASLSARLSFLATACLIAVAAVFLTAPSALAKSYECEEVNIEADVAASGTLTVHETRTLNFDGSFSLYGVVLDPPDGGDLKVTGVTVTGPDGKAHKLDSVEFEKEWRTKGGPGAGYYSVDEARDSIYCFWKYVDDIYSVSVDYKYTNAVIGHLDVSELYWQFVGTNWDVDPGDVTARITLPVPEGQSVVPEDNVRAWGHGALSGTVRFDDDGSIVYNAPRTESGDFVEARIVFPGSWTPKIMIKAGEYQPALDSILAEEQEWASKANFERLKARIFTFGPAGLSFAVLIMCLVMFFRHGREYTTVFQGDYWRDVPDKGTEPAVVRRIMYWGEKSTDEFTATLMRLSARGAISMEKTTELKRGLLGSEKQVDHYALVQTHREGLELTDLERRAYSIVFDKIGKGADRVEFDRIKKYAEKNPESFSNAISSWQDRVGTLVNKKGAFEREGDHWSRVFRTLAVILIVVGVVVVSISDNFLPLVTMLPCSIITFILGGKVRRRSQEAAEIAAKGEALKRWFKDFTNLKEALPTDTKVWGELLVYAYLMGVAKEVVEKLRVAMPQMWEDDYFYGYTYWYWMPDRSDTFSTAFDSAFTNAMDTARAATSSDSSGGGGGGGFSLGGGGGFGGGGGGFAR